jgi:AcrR family transcriptional regulator
MNDRTDTPARLVAAAERLFAEGGEEATSLRAVSRLAHANVAAVHYHFGGRDNLLRAVFDRHVRPLSDLRSRLLDEAAREDPVTVTGILTACVRPDLELLGKLRKKRVEIARFLGRTAIGPGGPAWAGDAEPFALELLRRAVPGVSSDELAARLGLVRHTVAASFAAASDSGAYDVDEQIRRLVAFAAGGITAPPAATRHRSGRKRRKGAEPAA